MARRDETLEANDELLADDELLTTPELAKEWKRAPETLERWRRLRKGPPFMYLNGRVIYVRRRANEWLVQQQGTTTNSTTAGNPPKRRPYEARAGA